MNGSSVVLMLHHQGLDTRPSLAPPGEGPGEGVLFYYTVADVWAAFDRAESMNADLLDSPHENPLSHAMEFSLRDPDGYGLCVAARMG